MPTVYQAQCGKCSYASEIFPADYGAIFLDEPDSEVPRALESGTGSEKPKLKSLLTELEDRRFLVLAHPGEGQILEEAGYTWDTLKKAGRYVCFSQVVCECGWLFQVRKLTCPAAHGCLGGCLSFAAMLIASIAVGFWLESLWIAMGAFLVFGLAFGTAEEIYGRWYIRRYFRERAQSIDGPSRCPRCGSTNFVSIAVGRRFPCPQCGEKAMRFIAVAKS